MSKSIGREAGSQTRAGLFFACMVVVLLDTLRAEADVSATTGGAGGALTVALLHIVRVVAAHAEGEVEQKSYTSSVTWAFLDMSGTLLTALGRGENQRSRVINSAETQPEAPSSN